MTAFLLRLCVINHLSRRLPDDYRHLTQARAAHYKTLAAKTARQRYRRAIRASTSSRSLQTRRRRHGSQSLSTPLRIRGLVQQQVQQQQQQHPLDHSSSAESLADTDNPEAMETFTAVEPPLAIKTSPMPSSLDTCPSPASVAGDYRLRSITAMDTSSAVPDTPRAHHGTPPSADGNTEQTHDNVGSSPTERGRCHRRPQPAPAADRASYRLSLTIPIAPPTSGPSRPMPASVAPPPIPPAAVETPKLPLSSDANDFIIAVAAQERRVLELREELARAEADLALLKSRWIAEEPHTAKGTGPVVDLPGSATVDMADDVSMASRRSAELDRRKLLLQSQGLTQDTPGGNRRKVIRGGHARTLSLLSPARMSSDFSLLGNNVLGATDPRPAQATNPAQLKRASWQPRSVQSSPTVPRFVEDFKSGLRAFVDDIRQITVGEEPIRGAPLTSRGPLTQRQNGVASRGPERQRSGLVSRTQSTPSPSIVSPVLGSRNVTAVSIERPKPVKSKPFSFTPLRLDSMDDCDWSNWESPSAGKTTRWSGSTMNSGGGAEEIGSIPEVLEDGHSPGKSKSDDKMGRGSRLEEMLPNMANRMSASNFKRKTSSDWMDEWEKALVSPDLDDRENQENQGPAPGGKETTLEGKCKAFHIPEEGQVPAIAAECVDGDVQNQVLVFAFKGLIHAMNHSCPHSSYPLSHGTVFDIEDFGVVLSAGLTCTKHGWSFDLFSGRGDRGNYRLGLWDVDLRGDDGADKEVWVRRRAAS
ncbi:hypothetical protein XA68_13580 [Ophiocordyceps unilateralis]|uniref:Rieske domain-containing protein n=1 Tax=Ophiocordyceps unilateralis TaxID=268505 RepID=A0A2A9PCG1_OPHUN|nr:hypothetical protein XA68_13580 [Ophiocordyceps unilateralis]